MAEPTLPGQQQQERPPPPTSVSSPSPSSSSSRRPSLQQDTSQPAHETPPIPRGENDPIPPLHSISSSIFVPIPPDTDLCRPLTPPTIPEDETRSTLSVVNAHEAAVRNNLQALFQRELLRLTRNAEPHDAQFDYFGATAAANKNHPDEEPLQREDLANMIAMMRAPLGENQSPSVQDIPVPDFDAVPITYAPIGSPRENLTRELFKVMSAAINDLADFDRHVHNIRQGIMKKKKRPQPQPQSQSQSQSEPQPEQLEQPEPQEKQQMEKQGTERQGTEKQDTEKQDTEMQDTD